MDEDNCPCQKISGINEKSSWRDVWEELKKLHCECPAVRFLLPDCKSWFNGYIKLIKKQRAKQKKFEPQGKSSWLANIQTCSHCEYRFSCVTYNTGLEKETAFHQSTLVLALRRGHLNHITSPIHRYCLSKEKPLKKQYKEDLKETWFQYDDSSERHEKSRIWMGRMAELKVAEWLEENEWKIEGMEAWGGKSDIKTKNPDNKETLIEVKYIGQEDENFKHLVANLAGGSATQSHNPYKAFNYALFRIFEAAKQLSKMPNSANAKKKVALVIDSSTWNSMEIPLKWMCGGRYRFFEEEVEQDINWCNFHCNTVKSQKNIKKYGDDLFNMHNIIKQVNRIRVFRTAGWELIKEMEWTPPATVILK